MISPQSRTQNWNFERNRILTSIIFLALRQTVTSRLLVAWPLLFALFRYWLKLNEISGWAKTQMVDNNDMRQSAGSSYLCGKKRGPPQTLVPTGLAADDFSTSPLTRLSLVSWGSGKFIHRCQQSQYTDRRIESQIRNQAQKGLLDFLSVGRRQSQPPSWQFHDHYSFESWDQLPQFNDNLIMSTVFYHLCKLNYSAGVQWLPSCNLVCQHSLALIIWDTFRSFLYLFRIIAIILYFWKNRKAQYRSQIST